MEEKEEQADTSSAGFTLLQADAHYNTVMAEAQPLVVMFQMLQEEQRYNLGLLEHHRRAEVPASRP